MTQNLIEERLRASIVANAEWQKKGRSKKSRKEAASAREDEEGKSPEEEKSQNAMEANSNHCNDESQYQDYNDELFVAQKSHEDITTTAKDRNEGSQDGSDTLSSEDEYVDESFLFRDVEESQSSQHPTSSQQESYFPPSRRSNGGRGNFFDDSDTDEEDQEASIQI